MKTTLLELTQDIEIVVDGKTTIEEVTAGQVVRAAPNKVLVDGQYVPNPGTVDEYIRLHLVERGSWKWDAPVADWNESVSTEPSKEPRWLQK